MGKTKFFWIFALVVIIGVSITACGDDDETTTTTTTTTTTPVTPPATPPAAAIEWSDFYGNWNFERPLFNVFHSRNISISATEITVESILDGSLHGTYLTEKYNIANLIPWESGNLNYPNGFRVGLELEERKFQPEIPAEDQFFISVFFWRPNTLLMHSNKETIMAGGDILHKK